MCISRKMPNYVHALVYRNDFFYLSFYDFNHIAHLQVPYFCNMIIEVFKKILSTILFLALLLPVFVGMQKITRYVFDYNEYKAQCKNRENLEVSCNGLCKFGSELASDESKPEKQQPTLPTIENLIPLFVYAYSESSPKFPLWNVHQTALNHAYREPKSQLFINELIKPPIMV